LKNPPTLSSKGTLAYSSKSLSRSTQITCRLRPGTTTGMTSLSIKSFGRQRLPSFPGTHALAKNFDLRSQSSECTMARPDASIERTAPAGFAFLRAKKGTSQNAAAGARCSVVVAAVLTLSGCTTPMPSATVRMPMATEACSRVPLGVSLEEAAATALERDGTLLMGGSRHAALFALKNPKNCGCTVELRDGRFTVTSRAQCG
jgi:hypothetical protein